MTMEEILVEYAVLKVRELGIDVAPEHVPTLSFATAACGSYTFTLSRRESKRFNREISLVCLGKPTRHPMGRIAGRRAIAYDVKRENR